MRDRIIVGEIDIAKVKDSADRRELRNFMRFLKLWPIHGYDMLERQRWQKYLGISAEEAAVFQKHPPFKAARP